MIVNIEPLSDCRVAYMRRTGAYGRENYELMSRLKDWAENNGLLGSNSVIYGIAHDNFETTPPEKCRYDVCIIVSEEYTLDESVQEGRISNGLYATFTIDHTVKAVQEFWNSCHTLIRRKKYQIDPSRPILERYKSELIDKGLCEFCVPITK